MLAGGQSVLVDTNLLSFSLVLVLAFSFVLDFAVVGGMLCKSDKPSIIIIICTRKTIHANANYRTLYWVLATKVTHVSFNKRAKSNYRYPLIIE